MFGNSAPARLPLAAPSASCAPPSSDTEAGPAAALGRGHPEGF